MGYTVKIELTNNGLFMFILTGVFVYMLYISLLYVVTHSFCYLEIHHCKPFKFWSNELHSKFKIKFLCCGRIHLSVMLTVFLNKYSIL